MYLRKIPYKARKLDHSSRDQFFRDGHLRLREKVRKHSFDLEKRLKSWKKERKHDLDQDLDQEEKQVLRS